MKQHSKNERVLNLYTRFCEGKAINKAEEAERFGVDERSVQRDIDDIRAFLDERSLTGTDTRTIEYNRAKKHYIMVGSEGSMMTNSEILATSKILLESRAFTKKEISSILDKMIAGCVPQKNVKLVSDLVANEKFHYVELNEKSLLKDLIWDIGVSIKERKLAEISYERKSYDHQTIKRLVEPLSILFSEYYFYLLANFVEKDENGKIKKIYDYPAVLRIDRIVKFRPTNETFYIEYKDRFEEGEFRKRVQFMYPGKLERVQFKFLGSNIEPVLDRLPTAKVISKENNSFIIEAEAYGKGLLMWLLSQGDKAEVIKPETFKNEMIQTLKNMLEIYG
ncbi:MAG: WYL domain-containing protein [Ruminococcaceae bacterium]|nr:WYL domain-containing protein [Oscillospiraceae bacterium]